MRLEKPTFRQKLLDYIVEHQPVDATFIGLHQRDQALPDLSRAGIEETQSALASLGTALEKEPQSGRNHWERIDARLIQGFVEIQVWEKQSAHFHRGNPSYYTGEAILGIMGLFLTPFAPFSQRVEAATGRMRSVPRLLEQGLQNLESFPPAWRERALREVEGALKFLTQGIEQLVPESLAAAGDFHSAAQAAAEAFNSYARALSERHANPDEAAYGCGKEPLDLLLRQGHFLHLLGFDGKTVAEYAEQEFQAATASLEKQAAETGLGDTLSLLGQLREIHPPAQQYYQRYAKIWDEARKLAHQKELLSWPDFPINYVPRPLWARQAAPYLYFLYYRSPAAFNRPETHEYLVEPIDQSGSAQEQSRVLQAHNESVIKLNHVAHHGSIGHHVQNWHAFRSPSLVGRIAAVDCASRIAMFCGGTIAEGWACYATDLMSEAGFLNPLEKIAGLHSRARICARAVVDVGLHQGRMTLDEVTQFYREKVGMSPAAARSESVKNSMFPATGLMYLMGTDAIHRLRGELKVLWSNDFSLKRFHDEFLSYGSIPVALIREEMLESGKDADLSPGRPPRPGAAGVADSSPTH